MPALRKIQSGDDGLKEWCDLLIGVRLPEDFGPERIERVIREWRSGIGDLSTISNSAARVCSPYAWI